MYNIRPRTKRVRHYKTHRSHVGKKSRRLDTAGFHRPEHTSLVEGGVPAVRGTKASTLSCADGASPSCVMCLPCWISVVHISWEDHWLVILRWWVIRPASVRIPDLQRQLYLPPHISWDCLLLRLFLACARNLHITWSPNSEKKPRLREGRWDYRELPTARLLPLLLSFNSVPVQQGGSYLFHRVSRVKPSETFFIFCREYTRSCCGQGRRGCLSES